MIRPIISYALTSLILLAQVGLPLHMHYCKGILESVSVFFSAKCDDHALPANLPVCCKKALSNHCSKNDGKKCCDDEVKMLKQDITSIGPSFAKWVNIGVYDDTPVKQEQYLVNRSLPVLIGGETSNSGPPIFILYHSLIFYA